MSNTEKTPRQKKERSTAQIKADKAYQERTRAEKLKAQKANFKNIGATVPKAEAEKIADLLRVNGLKPVEIIRATAQNLTTNPTAADEIRTAAAKWKKKASESRSDTTKGGSGGE